MYNTLDELYLHTANDDLADIISEIVIEDGETETIYALVTAYFLGWFNNPLKGNPELWWNEQRMFNFLRSAGAREEWDTLNNLLHILHSQSGQDLRSEIFSDLIMDEIARSFGIELPEDEANPTYEGIVLSGKDAVPDEWQAAIREAVADLEVGVRIHMSWVFSHFDYGYDYDYSIPEAICVELFGADNDVVSEAKRRIDSLHFVWKEA